MNLIIDIGNTSTKLAVFQRDKVLIAKTVEGFSLVIEVENLLKQFTEIKRGFVSSVGFLSEDELKTLEKRLPMTVLNSTLKLPFKVHYKTPNSLGADRLALMAAAATQYSGKNVLVIDAGSCITYDFIDSKKNYLGGAIAPGIQMRYKSLGDFTSSLPTLQKIVPKNSIGNSTHDSIHSGVINGVLYEIEGTVNEYQNKYPDLTVILTGGDADFLCKQLKISIFANSDFLLEGLNFLLEYNSN
jgi:type III pantothenate kinase